MVRCNLCKSTQSLKLYQVERIDATFWVARCESCGLVFQDPLPKKIVQLYGPSYFKGKGFDPSVNYASEMQSSGRKERFLRERLAWLGKHADGRKLLDVGCAYGHFLSLAKEAGWDCYGAELSKHAATAAKRNIGDRRIHTGMITDAPWKAKSFDCITMMDVIEHVADPMATICRAYELLRPGGLLLIETADVDSIIARIRKEKWGYFLTGHLFYFSRKTLRAYLMEAGFDDVEVLRGDEVPIHAHLRIETRPYRMLRQMCISAARKVGINDIALGGMVAIARK